MITTGLSSPALSMCSVSSIAAAAMKLAADPIVGWSKSTVGGSSASNYEESTFASSAAASESSPAAMSGPRQQWDEMNENNSQLLLLLLLLDFCHFLAVFYQIRLTNFVDRL